MKPGDAPPAETGRTLDPAARAIQRQAAEWLAQRESRGFTADEHARFAAWCAADPRHRTMFAEVESAWRVFDRLKNYPHSLDEAADPDLLARADPARRSFAGPLLAAAAGLVVAAAWWLWPGVSPVRLEKEPAPAAVVQAGPRLVMLPDGSEVELNVGGEIEEHYMPEVRRVRLVRGEAHFAVAKNPARPFVVEAGGVAVRAVGTAFNVRVAAQGVEVLVTEGRVRVGPPAGETPSAGANTAASEAVGEPPLAATAVELSVGQRVVMPVVPAPAAVEPVVQTLAAPEMDRVLAWQTSRLVLEATPLADVVRQFNHRLAAHRRTERLTLKDGALGAVRISGRIRSDNLESFIEVLETNFDVVAERRAGGEIALRRR